MDKDALRDRFRLAPGLLAAALAAGACTTGGGGGTTGPSESAAPPPAPTTFVTWTGPVRFSTVQTPRDTGFYNTYFEGTVVWQKETTPDPREDLPVLPGGVRYRVASGQVHVRVRGLRIFLFPEPYSCTDEGDGDVALTPNDTRSAFPDEAPFSHLDVTPDGRYAGYLYKEAGLTVVRTCEERLFPNATEGVLSFGFSGMLNASRRIQGEMTEASTFETESAAWDFSGR